MNRIYLRHLDLLIYSDNRSRAFLSYMKIRNSSKGRCGGFNLTNLIESLQVSDTSARKSLKLLLSYGYVSEVKKGLYKVNSFKSLIGDNLHERYFKISNEELFSYSWRNISSFRAMLVELRVQVNRNIRKKIRSGFSVVGKHGVREKIKSQSNKDFDTLVASTYTSKITGKSYSTILRYRTKQKLVKYSSIVHKKFKNSIEIKNFDFSKGKDFVFGNNLIFIPISSRTGKVKFNGY